MSYSLIRLFISFISIFVPVDKKVYIFGSWFGRKFSDNPKYFYNYLLKQHKDINVYWYTSDEELYL